MLVSDVTRPTASDVASIQQLQPSCNSAAGSAPHNLDGCKDDVLETWRGTELQKELNEEKMRAAAFPY